MRAINSTLEELAIESEGRYLSASELQPLQRYLKTFSLRIQTYNLLRERSDKLVQLAMKKFMPMNPELMQKHGKRCQYDMNEVMRYIALSVLRDDERFFKEVLFFWQANILTAYRQNQNCLNSYRCLQEVITEYLPAQASQLINPYLEIILQTLDLPPKLMATVQKSGATF
jgi:hypothetical protein